MLAAGCRQRVTVDEPLTPFDRIAPMSTGGTPITGNAFEETSASLMQPLRLIAVHPCSCRRCWIRNFTTAPSLTAYQQSTSRDSDVPPSCVVGISQTRLSGTGQCHYKSKEYNLCSFNQWPSANAGCMNSPSKDIPMRFMTFSEGMLGTIVR